MKYLSFIVICTVLCVSLSACGDSQNQNSSIPQATKANEVMTDTAIKLEVPISSDELQDIEYTEIAQMFSEAGFINVETEVVYDQDPDILDSDYLNEVKISYSTHFAKGDEFNENSLVKVICHLPYTKHDVIIHIDFIPNLFFSTYDVNYAMNGEEIGTLTHGKDKDITFRLKEGEYTFTFSQKGASSNHTDLVLNIDDDIEAAYKLSCASNKITLDTIYVESKHAAGEGQVIVPDSASNFKYAHYKDVLEKLEKAGFTNITTNALYDIVFGWTGEGEVGSVTIDTMTNFTRGDVFDADAPVVITYHMKEKDDPTKTNSDNATDSGANDDNVFNGITFEIAYCKKITTKRDRLNTYYLFDEDENTVYEVVYSKGPVPKKGTIEKTTYKIGTFEGELDGNITIHFGGGTFYYTTRTGSMIQTDENWETFDLIYDPIYTQCEIGDALAVLRNAELEN